MLANTQNIQGTQTTQQPKTKQPDLKMVKGPEQTFLKRRQTNGQQVYGKVINISNHQKMQIKTICQNQFSLVAKSCLTLCQMTQTQMTTGHQASLSITNSWSLLKFMSIESVMPSNHFILCHPLLLPPSIFPSIRVFSKESVLRIRWPKNWSFSFS